MEGEKKILDEGGEEESTAKRLCLMTGEKDKAVPSLESDEEFIFESDSGEDSISTDDSGDIEEDDDESGCNVSIITSFLISMRPEDSKYCLVKGPQKKELKLVVPEEDVQKAKTFAVNCFEKDLIPVFEADGTEIAQSTHVGLAYCDCLKPVPTDYVFSSKCGAEKVDGTLVRDNSLCVIKLKDSEEYFATSDLKV